MWRKYSLFLILNIQASESNSQAVESEAQPEEQEVEEKTVKSSPTSSQKNSKKQEPKEKTEKKKKKKSKFLVSEDDNVNIHDLDRNYENSSVTHDIVENFVFVLL